MRQAHLKNNPVKRQENNDKIDFKVWKKIFKLIFKSKKNVIFIIISMVALSILDITFPLLSSKALDVFFGDNPQYDLMWWFISAYVVIAFLYAITIYTFIKRASYIEAEVAHEIREEAFVHLQDLSLSYYDKNAAGWIMARLTSDSRKLAEIISWGIVDMIWGIATMLGILVMLLITFPLLALVIILLTPIIFVICLYFRKRILIAYRDVRHTNSKITGLFNEGILGSKTTKTLVLEDVKNIEFTEMCVNMKKASMKAIRKSSLLNPIVITFSYFCIGIILSIGSGFVLGSFGDKLVMTFSTLYLFINYTNLYFDPLAQISRVLAELQQGQAAAERIISLIETKPDIIDRPDVIEKYGTLNNPKRENWEPLIGDVEFENVSFKYIENETVLKNFNLKVKAGTSVALVGATGSGKSTIVNLLCRFYEPTEGIIKIDGKDYKDRSINWLHENLGYVLQTPHLFSGTIRENIAYSKLDATDEEIIRAAKIVNADEFISKLEEGYNTNVGEGGSKLSVGERQLISFARAILNNPKILVLDEATASIDTQTEVLIQKGIDELMKGRTSFIVAHRLSTITNSDLILVIKDGKVIEKGNHLELLALKGEYFNLYRNQFVNEQVSKKICI